MSYQTTTDITLDIRKTNVQSVRVKQYDDETRILHFIIVDNNQQIDLRDNYRVNFKASTPDNRAILDTCEVLDDGTAQIVLNDNVLSVPGRMRAEIQLVNVYAYTETDGVLTTMPFMIQVVPSACSDSSIISSDEFSALVDALERVERLERLAGITNSDELNTLLEALAQLEDAMELNRLAGIAIYDTYADALSAKSRGEIKDNQVVLIRNDEEVDDTTGSGGSGSADYPIYTGSYEVTPTVNEQLLATRNKSLTDNIEIHSVPFSETSNTSGGTTVNIAFEQ